MSLRVLGPGYRVEPSDWVVGLGFDEIRIALDNFSVKREPFRNNFRISFTLFELTSSADGADTMILSIIIIFKSFVNVICVHEKNSIVTVKRVYTRRVDMSGTHPVLVGSGRAKIFRHDENPRLTTSSNFDLCHMHKDY